METTTIWPAFGTFLGTTTLARHQIVFGDEDPLAGFKLIFGDEERNYRRFSVLYGEGLLSPISSKERLPVLQFAYREDFCSPTLLWKIVAVLWSTYEFEFLSSTPILYMRLSVPQLTHGGDSLFSSSFVEKTPLCKRVPVLQLVYERDSAYGEDSLYSSSTSVRPTISWPISCFYKFTWTPASLRRVPNLVKDPGFSFSIQLFNFLVFNSFIE